MVLRLRDGALTRDAETEDEAAADKLTLVVRRSNHCRTNTNDDLSRELVGFQLRSGARLTPPQNMQARRPQRSAMGPANQGPTMPPIVSEEKSQCIEVECSA